MFFRLFSNIYMKLCDSNVYYPDIECCRAESCDTVGILYSTRFVEADFSSTAFIVSTRATITRLMAYVRVLKFKHLRTWDRS